MPIFRYMSEYQAQGQAEQSSQSLTVRQEKKPGTRFEKKIILDPAQLPQKQENLRIKTKACWKFTRRCGTEGGEKMKGDKEDVTHSVTEEIKDEEEACMKEESSENVLFLEDDDQEEVEVKQEEITSEKLGPTSHYRPQRAVKDKSVMSFMSR